MEYWSSPHPQYGGMIHQYGGRNGKHPKDERNTVPMR
jgi:hypothetical protein